MGKWRVQVVWVVWGHRLAEAPQERRRIMDR